MIQDEAGKEKKRTSSVNKRPRIDDGNIDCDVTEVQEVEDERTLIGVHRVELAKSGSSHCGWCDTIIKKGEPRVVKRQFHGPGEYVRNSSSSISGATTSTRGYNPGGIQDEFLHPQCTWTHMVVNSRGKGVKCRGASPGCHNNKLLEPGSWNFVTRMGSVTNRCTESSSGKLWQCKDCVKFVVTKYRNLLSGHISERSQFKEPVTWISSRKNTLFGNNNDKVTGSTSSTSHTSNRAESKNRKVKEQLRDVFRDKVLREKEDEAVARHKALQDIIKEALKNDKIQKREEKGI
eukprot:CAMPEP_0171036418 /NCGR_PEP_ID=MMETSP0736-20130129/41488_1 /TAXON_ID=186038 /ORGANISM="Fragilariopsis kerguelensis, Strain L26-C5" /LENGTH=290 /DNA_ID=CAMNT_0011481385 /DNA_START=332 /DNA_END=1204 /DNA_ORIENTATION=-